MSSPANELALALRRRRVLVADENSRRDSEQHLAKLKAISEEIERLGKQLPQPIDPRLTHFLTRCSYDKALDFLEGTV